jgi:RHS repeat-associated protein
MDMTDATGNATGCAGGTNCAKLAYDEYGNLSAASVATGQPYRFTGRMYDAETGMYYYRARYYTPQLGRFMQFDPIGYQSDVDLYLYVGDDPLDKTDPSGNCPICALGGAAAGYVVAVGFQLHDGNSWGSALTSKESAGAALAGAIVGGATGSAAESAMGAKAAESTAGAISSAAVSEVAGDATEHIASRQLEKATEGPPTTSVSCDTHGCTK